MLLTDETNGSASNPEALRFMCEIHQKMIWESANLLTKAIAFYLAITAGLIGYVLSQRLQPPLPRYILLACLCTSVLFAIFAGMMLRAMLASFRIVKDAAAEMDARFFERMRMGALFQQWRVFAITFGVCAGAEVCLIAAGLLLLLLGNRGK